MANLSFPITRAKIRHHFQYAWWQYVLLAVVAVFGWNILHTTTRYRPPEALRVEWYFEGGAGMEAQAKADALLSHLTPDLFPAMEETIFAVVGTDPTYGDMQLMVWMAAGQGDLYQLSRDHFRSYAAEGAWVDLQPYVDSGLINVEGIDLTWGYGKDAETGETHLYGIPADALQGFQTYDLLPEGTVLCLLQQGGNTENCAKLLAWMVNNLR